MKDDIDCSSGCPIGSCHGLLCFERNNSETYIVNPVLGSDDDLVIMLPSMNTETEVPSLFPVRIFNLMGFGFCPKTNQYKVVRTIRSTLRVYICTLGTDDSWREIEDLPTDRFTSCLPGVYLNGALHWLTYPRIESDDRKLEIYCFDVETEKSHQLDLLPQLLQGRNNLDGLKLGVISGVAPLSVWNRDRVEPLMLTEDGNSLIAYAEEDDERRLLKYFDVRTGENITNRMLIEKGTITSGRRYTAHVATLMSPKHIMKRSTCHV
ncbi:hypothetical protein COLO4_09908 [Corchorus olitorius]|uniref:F-box associated beta-propeller type 1 domain-containing protein n=1 Tax=Corchorus olitorius TaxID=93759 RepID=A0A1R3KAS9_9ROSI|nr:hypothetical protein COLO4_09908 [Corchorus olitorius]